MQLSKSPVVLFVMVFVLLFQGGVQEAGAQDVKDIHKAAQAGDASAQYTLCAMYNSGRGVPKNIKRAKKWCKKAAKGGHVDAQFYLGVMYETGRGVSQKNMKEAVKWYRAAAAQGNVEAQYTLSLLSLKGDGVPKDRKNAKSWYDSAAKTWEARGGDRGAGAALRHQ